jgi:putative acetyltransferase
MIVIRDETAMIVIRDETASDYEAVHRVNQVAFSRPEEANLVESLRDAGSVLISLVAVIDQDVIGHILFSPVTVKGAHSDFQAIALGPMAVLPEHQRTGIGSQLVRDGLAHCSRAGKNIVFVVGHPRFYPRFGFVPARQLGFECEYSVPDDVFMVAELRRGALGGRSGMVRYHPAFNQV